MGGVPCPGLVSRDRQGARCVAIALGKASVTASSACSSTVDTFGGGTGGGASVTGTRPWLQRMTSSFQRQRQRFQAFLLDKQPPVPVPVSLPVSLLAFAPANTSRMVAIRVAAAAAAVTAATVAAAADDVANRRRLSIMPHAPQNFHHACPSGFLGPLPPDALFDRFSLSQASFALHMPSEERLGAARPVRLLFLVPASMDWLLRQTEREAGGHPKPARNATLL